MEEFTLRLLYIDYNRMELRKIWHDGRFSVRASESSSVVRAAELLIGQIGPRSFSLVRLVQEAEIMIVVELLGK